MSPAFPDDKLKIGDTRVHSGDLKYRRRSVADLTPLPGRFTVSTPCRPLSSSNSSSSPWRTSATPTLPIMLTSSQRFVVRELTERSLIMTATFRTSAGSRSHVARPHRPTRTPRLTTSARCRSSVVVSASQKASRSVLLH